MMSDLEISGEEKIIPATGTLFVVSTPIGNDDDITVRALKVLRSCDLVVCEEAKVGARMLHKYNVTQKMELLNEQNEFEQTPELISLLLKGKNLALTSDAGTPVFADPGFMLVQAAMAKDIPVIVVPGPSCIMTAIVRSGFPISQFVYAGFLSRSGEERAYQLKRLSEEGRTVVLLETPYRLVPFLEAAAAIMPSRKAYIGCNLTMAFETHHYGTFAHLAEKFRTLRFKGEFVVCFEGAAYNDGEGHGESRDSEFVPRFDRNDRRPRIDRNDRPPRKEWSDRPPRKEWEDRPPRRELSDRPPRKEWSDRPPRGDSSDRPPRREWSDRPPRSDSSDRPPRKEWSDRPPRRDSSDRPPRREWSDRPPRRDSDRGSDGRTGQRPFNKGGRPPFKSSGDRKPFGKSDDSQKGTGLKKPGKKDS